MEEGGRAIDQLARAGLDFTNRGPELPFHAIPPPADNEGPQPAPMGTIEINTKKRKGGGDWPFTRPLVIHNLYLCPPLTCIVCVRPTSLRTPLLGRGCPCHDGPGGALPVGEGGGGTAALLL